MEDRDIEIKRRRRRRKRRRDAAIVLGILFIIAALIIYGVFALVRSMVTKSRAKADAKAAAASARALVLTEAEKLAAGFDYDAAMAKIAAYPGYETDEELSGAYEKYAEGKKTLVEYPDIKNVTHIFFHTLIVDPSLAFDGDYKEAGYNQYMTTVDEFNKILEQMYDRGYILISLHDMAEIDESGRMTAKKLMLPEGRIPFVMSQDDVCYYEYMTGDGFATKLVVGEDGLPTCEYKNKDGSVTTGDYDLVPLLDRFIEKHPDFSYKGAKAVLALTGYDGVLGYRTSPTGNGYSESEVAEAKKVADALKADGFEFASHSWGHLRYGDIEFNRFANDVKKWNDEVTPIVGKTDIMIYANGFDIAGIEAYSGDRYNLLKSYGFNYFCNVDSHRYWVQMGEGYLRQGRRNLDGYRMYYNPELLNDLFNVTEVFDSSRTTPVPQI